MKNTPAIRPFTGQDLLDIWKRRRWIFLGIALFGSACTCIVVGLWPGMYRATALVLIEQPSVSQDLSKAMPTSDAEQQIAGLVQEVLSRTLLYRLPVFNGGKKLSEADLDDALQKVSIDVLRENSDPRRPAGKPYGLKANFSSHTPRVAQQGANQLAGLIVQEADSMMLRQAKDAATALRAQLELATAEVRERSDALADFSKQNAGQLPIEQQLTIDTLARLQAQLQGNSQAMERARQTISDLENSGTGGQEGNKNSNTQDSLARLKTDMQTLKTKLIDLESRYKPGHPDVIKTVDEIQRLQNQITVEEAHDEHKTAPVKNNLDLPSSSLSRIEESKAEIEVRAKEQARIEQQIAHYQANLSAIPLRAQQFTELQRGYEGAKKNYETLRDEVLAADQATDIYQQHKGIRFHVQDYAALPDSPESPVRWKLNLGGLAVSIFLGLLIPAVLELRDTSFKSHLDVEFYTGLRSLALLPELCGAPETRPTNRRMSAWIAASAVATLALAGANCYLYFLR